jgi:hypothetical protein
MLTKTFMSVSSLVAAAFFAFANPVHASFVNFHVDAYTPGYSVDRTVDGSNFSRVKLGYFTITRTGGDYAGNLLGPFSSPDKFIAWCIEPGEPLGVNRDYTHNANPLASGATNIGGMGADKAQALNDLFGTYYPDFRAPITDDKGVALQAAIWEIVREDRTLNGWDLTKGLFQFRGPGNTAIPTGSPLDIALQLAQTYLDAIGVPGPHPQPLFATLALTKIGAQDIIVQDTPVPEPQSLVLLAVGFIPLVASLRRRKATAN